MGPLDSISSLHAAVWALFAPFGVIFIIAMQVGLLRHYAFEAVALFTKPAVAKIRGRYFFYHKKNTFNGLYFYTRLGYPSGSVAHKAFQMV